jgi:hypothetical protein
MKPLANSELGSALAASPLELLNQFDGVGSEEGIKVKQIAANIPYYSGYRCHQQGRLGHLGSCSRT